MTDPTAKQNAPTNARDSQQTAHSLNRLGNTALNVMWGAKVAKTEKVNFFASDHIAQMLSTGNNQVIEMQSVDRSADIFNGYAV